MKRASRSRFKHIRLAPKTAFDPRSFRTIDPGRPGYTKLVIGCPKGKFDAAKGRCKVETKAQRVLRAKNPDSYSIIRDGIEFDLYDYKGRYFDSDFVSLKDPSSGPGWFVFGRDQKSGVIKIVARPNVLARKHPHYNFRVRRGFSTKTEADKVARFLTPTLNEPISVTTARMELISAIEAKKAEGIERARKENPRGRAYVIPTEHAKAPKGYFANPKLRKEQVFVVTNKAGDWLAEFGHRDDAIRWAKAYANKHGVQVRIVEA